MEDLPTDHELIVVGSGLIESIIAAAAARIGKKVLHIDGNSYYGGDWASFNLEGINEWIRNAISNYNENDSLSISLSCGFSSFSNISNFSHSHSCVINGATIKLSELPFESKRKFNIDLSPKVLFSNGPMVKLLISSNSSKYLEFKNIVKMLTYHENSLTEVPFTRSAVFSSKDMTVIEKRLLMKLLASCSNEEPDNEKSLLEEFKSQPFTNFLKHHKLSSLTEAYVLSMLLSLENKEVNTEEGVAAVRKIIDSIGRYGPSPFLWPLYGSGELPQAFCRVCAVFGGIYFLSCPLKSLLLDDQNRIAGVDTGPKILKAEKVVVSSGCMNLKSLLPTSQPKNGVSRCILITDRSLYLNEFELTMGKICSPHYSHPIFMHELGGKSCSSMEGLFVVHLVTYQKETAEIDLGPTVREFFDISPCSSETNGDVNTSDECKEDNQPSKPQILWYLYFNVEDHLDMDLDQHNIDGLYICPGAGGTVDMAQHVHKARKIFESMYPGEEFLPRIPDSEEIIFDDPPAAEPNVMVNGHSVNETSASAPEE